MNRSQRIVTLDILRGLALFGFSILWLRRFQYGPLERVWRAATYLEARV